MRKALCAALIALFAALAVPSLAEGAPTLRALLIGSDVFVSQQNTGGAAEANVRMMAETIAGDARGYALIRTRVNAVSSVEAFERLVSETFMASDDDDISLLYISTHGLISDGGGVYESGLLLSDGENEEILTVRALQGILDTVEGVKVLLLDACNSGVFIGKGIAGGADRRDGIPFSSEDYKVLCSAGASEQSWYWQDGASDVGFGASYFATALCSGIGKGGQRPADGNLDGGITLLEMYRYVYDNCAVSTPQVYPQEDNQFSLFAYNTDEQAAHERAVTDLMFDSTLLKAGQSSVNFSFTVRRETALHYQIVYFRDGAWQFDEAEYYADTEGGGLVPPGAKTRSLMLKTEHGADSGYAIVQLITMEEGFPVIQGARVISVAPSHGNIGLHVEAESAFLPKRGQELAVSVYHDAPCGLTVTVLDMYGSTVRRLAYDQPTRPEHLSPEGSMFYWNGKKSDGSYAPNGEYTIQVKTTTDGRAHVAESAVFLLTDDQSERRQY